jgi:hypothetical protein
MITPGHLYAYQDKDFSPIGLCKALLAKDERVCAWDVGAPAAIGLFVASLIPENEARR